MITEFTIVLFAQKVENMFMKNALKISSHSGYIRSFSE